MLKNQKFFFFFFFWCSLRLWAHVRGIYLERALLTGTTHIFDDFYKEASRTQNPFQHRKISVTVISTIESAGSVGQLLIVY